MIDRTPARRVYLTRDLSLFCIVDEIDYPWIIKHRWNFGHGGRRHTPYAKRNFGTARHTVWLHRAIARVADQREEWFMDSHHVDHVNGQSLDCRRCNLEWSSNGDNTRRRHARNGQVPTIAWIWGHLCVEPYTLAEEVPF